MLGPELGNQVDFVEVLAWLEGQGWCRVPSRRPYAAVYRSSREPCVEVQVPLDRGLADYGEAITVVVRRVAALEQRPEAPILEELLRLSSARDSRFVRLVGKVVELLGMPGEHGEVEGTVVLMARFDNELLRVRLVLGPADYRTACAVHLEQREVAVEGVFVRAGQACWLERARAFEVR